MKIFTSTWFIIGVVFHVLLPGNVLAGWEVEGTLTYSIRLTSPGETAKKEFAFGRANFFL
jgi:hypothetical protein